MQAVLNLKLVVELPLLTKKSGSEGLTNRGVHLVPGLYTVHLYRIKEPNYFIFAFPWGA